jgi:hypothetical protein
MNLLTFARTTPSIKSTIEKEGINFFLLIYPKSYGVLPEFPTNNADYLSNEIMKIIRCYIAAPEIYTKIAMCYAIQTIGSELFSSITTNMNIRAREIQDLNLALYNISKKIIGQKVVAFANFIKVHSHQFHRESQFLEFIVKTK